MDFFEHLQQRDDIPVIAHPFVKPVTSFKDRLLSRYTKLFATRIKPMRPLALINGTMAVYDLTQPPMDSAPFANVIRNGFDYVILRRKALPINMVLMLNAVCDMKCRHCSARNYIQSDRKPLSKEEVKDLVDQFVDLGGSSLIYCGGEPTIHPDLLELVDYVPKDESVISIFSNGSRLEEMADELKGAGLFGTLVSIDSPDPAKHDEYRGSPGAFARAISAVRKMRELDMLVGISSYMTRQDLAAGDWDRVMQLAVETDALQVFMFDTVPTGAIIDEQEMVLRPEDRETLKKLTMAQNAAPTGPGVMGQSWVNSADGFGCFAGFYQLYVTAFGDVCPCDFTPISFGNIRETRLDVIWDRMRNSDDWGRRFPECRMQDVCFRERSIDLIPEGTPWPVTYEQILEWRKAADKDKCCDS